MADDSTVWMRAEDADPQEREFTKAHSDSLLALQASKGYDHWKVIKAPTNGKTKNNGGGQSDNNA